MAMVSSSLTPANRRKYWLKRYIRTITSCENYSKYHNMILVIISNQNYN